MPSPTTADLLKSLIPKAGDKLCDRFESGIVAYMEAVTKHFEYMYREDGTFAAEFAADLCLLPCIGTPTDNTGDTCPTIALVGTATIGDNVAHLSFHGTSMIAGYDWELFRREDDADPWVSIDTGVTTGSTVAVDDATATNGTTYQYKMTVQKAGCPQFNAEVGGVTPNECQTLSIALTGGPDASNPNGGGIAFTMYDRNNKITDDFLINAFASNDPTQLGGEIIPEVTVGASGRSCTEPGGNAAVCFTFEGLDPSKTYYYTFKIKEKVACDYSVLTASARPYPGKPNIVAVTFERHSGAGYLLFSGLVNPLAVPARIIVFAQDIGNLHPSDGFTPLHSYTPQFQTGTVNFQIGVTEQQWPCNYRIKGQLGCQARYLIYAVAVSAQGVQSEPSPQALIEVAFQS